ncbi:MAG: gamma-glutamylcyclotransferase [Phycisphaerae bacterium]|nr:gamma-glutamylcyclotransferase [Phycisphaerae bacterium]HAW95770.1 gamma-glutamylcyclotransferase [Phycisphaerales bacterium]|tara:strand:+ start:128 stop:598 length:471 start_codon:yes stop_codon:yes gene_type:complete
MRTACFAYGANIDAPAMRQRCPTAVCTGPAILHDHRPCAMQEGWLTIVKQTGWQTPGLLWTLEASDVRALDVYEDVDTGLYVKETRVVRRFGEGTSLEAMVYLGRNSGPGTLHEEYAGRVARAMRRELSMMGETSERSARLIESLAAPPDEHGREF